MNPDLPGTQITVTDESGKIVGLAHVAATGTGTIADGFPYCTFETPVTLDAAKFYTFKIGRFGGPTMSATDLASRQWVVDLQAPLPQ